MSKGILMPVLVGMMWTIRMSAETARTFLPEVKQEQKAQAQTAREIIFEDNFDQKGHIPDSTKWVLCPKRKPDWARYLSESYEQAYVADGKLVLIAEKKNGVYRVGGIHTKGKFSFRYGKIEVCARFTKQAQGTWPAIWMMSDTPRYAGAVWPAAGEIDIMEQLNHEKFVYQTIHSHYHNTLKHPAPAKTDTLSYTPGAYNIYSLEWTPEYLSFGVNGREGLRYPNLKLEDDAIKQQWPFDAPFYLILNVALGGEGTWPGAIDDAELPAKMEIDWVRISKPAL